MAVINGCAWQPNQNMIELCISQQALATTLYPIKKYPIKSTPLKSCIVLPFPAQTVFEAYITIQAWGITNLRVSSMATKLLDPIMSGGAILDLK